MAGQAVEAAPATVPLTEAAHRLGLGYQSARDLILKRKLDGRKDDGLWVVTVESLERAIQVQNDVQAMIARAVSGGQAAS